MFELANKLVGIYKINDVSKCITYDPERDQKGDKENNLGEEKIIID